MVVSSSSQICLLPSYALVNWLICCHQWTRDQWTVVELFYKAVKAEAKKHYKHAGIAALHPNEPGFFMSGNSL